MRRRTHPAFPPSCPPPPPSTSPTTSTKQKGFLGNRRGVTDPVCIEECGPAFPRSAFVVTKGLRKEGSHIHGEVDGLENHDREGLDEEESGTLVKRLEDRSPTSYPKKLLPSFLPYQKPTDDQTKRQTEA